MEVLILFSSRYFLKSLTAWKSSSLWHEKIIPALRAVLKLLIFLSLTIERTFLFKEYSPIFLRIFSNIFTVQLYEILFSDFRFTYNSNKIFLRNYRDI